MRIQTEREQTRSANERNTRVKVISQKVLPKTTSLSSDKNDDEYKNATLKTDAAALTDCPIKQRNGSKDNLTTS